LNAEDAMLALTNGGDKALWDFLDSYYDCVFNAADYPKPAEYLKPLRVNGVLSHAMFSTEEVSPCN
jgi:hypothetical protein